MREYPERINSDWVNPVGTVYDNVVRKDSFRPDAENVKDFNASGMAKGSGTGLYDTDTKENLKHGDVSQAIIALRENKLDKAEIENLKNAFKNKANSEVKENNDREEFEKASRIAKARNEAMDSILGVDSEE